MTCPAGMCGKSAYCSDRDCPGHPFNEPVTTPSDAETWAYAAIVVLCFVCFIVVAASVPVK